MSRSIVAQGSPTSGDVIILPFPDIQKPESGGWKLTVRLKSSDGACGEALVELLQQDTVLQSTTVTLTDSFADYDLEIPQPDLEKIARSRCSMTELYVRVRCTAGPPVPCGDDECDIPATLYVTPSCGTGSVQLDWNGTAWVGTTADFCGVPNATVTLSMILDGEGNPTCTFDLRAHGDCAVESQFANTGYTTCNPLLINFDGFGNCEFEESTATVTE